MLTLLEALDELNSKSESELTLDYLEELAKKVSIEPVVKSQVKHTTIGQKVYKKYSPQNVQVNG